MDLQQCIIMSVHRNDFEFASGSRFSQIERVRRYHVLCFNVLDVSMVNALVIAQRV